MTFPHTRYLRSLEMGDVLVQRLVRVYDFYNSILPEPVEILFVSDYFNEDGTRAYDSAWLFTETYVGEARDWATDDDWDLLRISRVTYWRIQKENYDFSGRATNRSRLNFAFKSLSDEGYLRAAGNNCKGLRDIILKYFMKDMGEAPPKR